MGRCRVLLEIFLLTFFISLYTNQSHAGWLDDCISALEDCANPDNRGEWQKIEYVGRENRTNFSGPGWGKHLIYFPAFGLTTPKENLSTDHRNSVELTPDFKNLKHLSELNQPWDITDRTFSLDAQPDGTRTAGGFSGWPYLVLPTGQYGRSGVAYDPYSRNNSSNIINKFILNTNRVRAFCFNIVTDNTKGRFDSNQRLVAQSDARDKEVPSTDLKFDGVTDVYTFKYVGIENGDRVQLKVRASNDKLLGGGFGGVMISDINTCCTASCGLSNECGGDNGCGDPCPCTKNEVHSNLIPNSMQGGQAYYLRGIYTRQVLTADTASSFVDMQPRRNLANQQWVFVGKCGSNTQCKGYFVNKKTKGCLRKQKKINQEWVYSGSCSGDKHLWVMKVNGYDEVIGDQDFPQSGGVYKYTIRHEPSNNNFLIAKKTRQQALDDGDDPRLKVKSRNNPNRPWEHWIFEAAQPDD